MPAALLAALALDAIARELNRRRVGARWLPVAVLLLPAIGLVTSLRVEPFGLAYRSEWLGGIAGAWRRGFDLEYWGGAITPKLLEEVAAMHGAPGDRPYILSVPKLDYFEAADDLWRGLVPGMKLDTLAVDASPAYYSAWATPELRQRGRVGLRLSSPRPLDGILVFYRRSWVEDGFQELMSVLVTRGDLRLIDETRVDGVVLAQLFAVERSIPVRLPGDPTGQVWFVPPSVPELVGYPPKP